MAHPLFDKHQTLLAGALEAIRGRGYWNPYSENPASYGDDAIEEGRKAFSAYFDAQFYLDQPGVMGRVIAGHSPFGLALDISFPQCSPDALIAAARGAMPAWIRAGAEVRAGVCAEILARLNERSMEIAHAVMHTTGQSLMMAFQSGGPQAQARGLEAVAQAWGEMKHVPESVLWERPQGKNPPLVIEKRFTVVPRGVSLVMACATAPTLAAYPALFASLATGNPVIVKPHPAAILPLAITVALARQTLKEAGFDASLVSLLVDDSGTPVAKDVAVKGDIRLIDCAGRTEYGEWFEENARQAHVFAQKSGVNCVVVESTGDYKGMLRNLAVTLSLHSGQTALTPRTILVSSEGIKTPDGTYAPEQFGRDLSLAISALLEDNARAVEVLGAIQSPDTVTRIDALRELGAESGQVLRDSSPLPHPQWPQARVHTPLLLRIEVSDRQIYEEERLGPISCVVETATASESFAIAERIMREKGAATFSVHSVNPVMQQLAEDVAIRAGVALYFNLTGGLYVTQSAPFSDFNGTGANPASSASVVDVAFVASRFHVVQSSRHAG
ncbi:MAG: phenylacetic acid degradation protein PaaN [Gammaproteobacteria bacterium]|nr:phenylacetic acid degradation protein PaaN [Gammaproteobacteria bacterium]MBU1647033.1 phenylacetic acid degradation protein PaaN [Gammaproteobacteria bacterium]MBU1972545.1 phenylacetic acid degradation protein PaaN [Gammaproteobacteria bacterium]